MADEPCVLIKRCNSDLSCCGIILDSENGIVLTVGSLFLDVLPQIEKRGKICADSPFLAKDDFATTSPNDEISVEVIFRRNGEKEFHTLQGHVAFYWRDYGLQRIAERIFPRSEWKFESLGQGEVANTKSHVEKGGGDEVLTHRNCLSDFVLIQLKTLSDYFSSKSVNLSTVDFEIPKKGDIAFVVGTPFGCECPPVFYNSISKGIVSNVVGANSEIIITDARCVPGCEGCPLYIKKLQSGLTKNSVPYGIVLAPFCWKNGEWTGITVATSLGYILYNLQKLVTAKSSLISQPLYGALLGFLSCQNKTENPVDLILKGNHCDRNAVNLHSDQDGVKAQDITNRAISSVVMVECGHTWGSGIIIDAEACLIATCSHVIRGCHDNLTETADQTLNRHLNSPTEVKIVHNGTHYKAQVLYATKEGCPLDFALLKVKPNPEFKSLRPRLRTDVTDIRTLYEKGEDICVVGFPLFASHLNMETSVVSGVISNIAYADSRPVLLQSTAAVQRGASGGALVSMVTGELLGMVTSHTKDADLSSTFPHVNFSIPSDLLYKLVFAVKNGTVEETLRCLVSDRVESVWQLKKTVNEKPSIRSKL